MREEFEEKARIRPGRPSIHRVLLSEADHKTVSKMLKNPANEYQLLRAKVILALDEGSDAKRVRPTYDEIAKANDISILTVCRIAKKFANGSLESAVNGNVTGAHFSSEEESLLLDLLHSCQSASEPWSVRRLARELGRSPKTISRAIQRLSDRGEVHLSHDS